MYDLAFKSQPLKYLRRMPGNQAARVRKALGKLAENPDRTDLDINPLHGTPGYRLRIGSWRVIFERDDVVRILVIERIAPRGDVYKK